MFSHIFSMLIAAWLESWGCSSLASHMFHRTWQKTLRPADLDGMTASEWPFWRPCVFRIFAWEGCAFSDVRATCSNAGQTTCNHVEKVSRHFPQFRCFFETLMQSKWNAVKKCKTCDRFAMSEGYYSQRWSQTQLVASRSGHEARQDTEDLRRFNKNPTEQAV